MLNAADLLLGQWLKETGEVQAQEILSVLISSHAEPTVRRIVSYKLTGGIAYSSRARSAVDVDDVCNESLRRLLTYLDGLKKGGGGPGTPRNFSNYVAVTAFNACNEYFREKSPSRYRLSNKLRYLVTHSPLFALWETEDGLEACGLAAMAGQTPKTDGSDMEFVHESILKGLDPTLTDVVLALFQAAGSALTFDLLFQGVAQLTGLQEQQTQWRESATDEGIAPWEKVAAPDSDIEAGLADRQYIARLWAEIRELPLQQRSALLLNLKDSAGGDIQIFDWLGIATVQEIADALEMKWPVFAELWKDLPLDDGRIAGLLGIDRQDVINRRSSARKRLTNRMREYGVHKNNARRANIGS